MMQCWKWGSKDQAPFWGQPGGLLWSSSAIIALYAFFHLWMGACRLSWPNASILIFLCGLKTGFQWAYSVSLEMSYLY